jgi:hypothetical protein
VREFYTNYVVWKLFLTIYVGYALKWSLGIIEFVPFVIEVANIWLELTEFQSNFDGMRNWCLSQTTINGRIQKTNKTGNSHINALIKIPVKHIDNWQWRNQVHNLWSKKKMFTGI